MLRLREMKPKIEHLQSMRAVHVYSFDTTPEEDAQKKILNWAEFKQLIGKQGLRLFGRNVYPTEKPEPHGYEYFLTLDKEFEAYWGSVETKEIQSGLYATLRFKNLNRIAEAWKTLLEWVEKKGYKQAGLTKTENGWVNEAFEEHVNWQENKPANEWVFNLWVKLKE